MANLAQQIKDKLTDEARNNDMYKKQLACWLIRQFHAGVNPVTIYIRDHLYLKDAIDYVSLHSNETDIEDSYFHLVRGDGNRVLLQFYVGNEKRHLDVTDTDFVCEYAFDDIDKQYKTLYLESEGFEVHDCWSQNKGKFLEIHI